GQATLNTYGIVDGSARSPIPTTKENCRRLCLPRGSCMRRRVRRLILKQAICAIALQFSAEKFGQRFHRLDVGTKDFERGEDRDRDDDTRDSPHPAPENQRKKNKDWI